MPLIVSDQLVGAARAERIESGHGPDGLVPLGPQTIRGVADPVTVWAMQEPGPANLREPLAAAPQTG